MKIESVGLGEFPRVTQCVYVLFFVCPLSDTIRALASSMRLAVDEMTMRLMRGRIADELVGRPQQRPQGLVGLKLTIINEKKQMFNRQ